MNELVDKATAWDAARNSFNKGWDRGTKDAAAQLAAKDALIAELVDMVRDFSMNSPRNVWPMHPSAVDSLLARASKASQD